MRRVLSLLVVFVVLAAACGDDDAGTAAGDTTTTAPASSSPTTPPTEPGPPGELPGEVIEIYPYADAQLAVVSVEADDVLNVRSGPGVSYDVVTTLGPLSMSAVATGHNRVVDESFWVELTNDGTTGWVNGLFVLEPGGIDDVTAAFYPLPADRPTAETLVDLAAVVAAKVASEDPPSDITIVDGPHVGDLGEITVDVIGLADDSVGGFRLHIFAESGDEAWTVRTVEQTTLCLRGVSEGLCT